MKIKILTDFSYTPGPRYIKEGRFSGEEFRKACLLDAIEKAIKADEILTVDLDGTAGYGRSFFEESFGGLIRIDGLDYESVTSHLEIVSEEEPEWKDKIAAYMKKADEQSKKVASKK